MKTGMSKNEYGTDISVHTCDTCGREFTVCPAVPDDEEDLKAWANCLADDCPSYNPNRDVDALLFFGCVEIKKVDDE